MRTRRLSRGATANEIALSEPDSGMSLLPVAEVARRPPPERAAWIGRLGSNAAATALLARQPAATAEPAAPLSHAEEVTKATEQLVVLVGVAAAPFIGSKETHRGRPVAEHIPDMLRARITRGSVRPKSKSGNPVAPPLGRALRRRLQGGAHGARPAHRPEEQSVKPTPTSP